jgi:hypothetical protein
MMDLLRPAVSIRLDDLVRHFLVANDLADASVIALDDAGGNDECSLKTIELSSPSSQSAIVGSLAGRRVARRCENMKI